MTGAHVFDFMPTARGNALTITPSASFRAGGLTAEQRILAGHLQRIWEGDDPTAFADGFTALAAIGDAETYATALDSLISRQVGAIATARADASRALVANMNSCPVFDGDGLLMRRAPNPSYIGRDERMAWR